MPDPARVLKTIQQATQAFRSTPGRRGRLVELPADATEVFATGDLHGSVENFRLLLKQADLAQNPTRHLVLQEVVHGPFFYPNGGDKSHQLLDLLAALKCQFPRQVHFLLGNHELSQMLGRRIAKGDLDLNKVFLLGVEAAYGSRANEVSAAYQQMLSAVPLAVRTPNRVFLSHSLPSEGHREDFHLDVLLRDAQTEADLFPGGTVHCLVWGRDLRLENVTAFLQLVDADLLITGHIPCDEGFEAPNERQLILDTLGTPAAYCCFPTTRPLTHAELVGMVKIL
jgi:hypothetical protein